MKSKAAGLAVSYRLAVTSRGLFLAWAANTMIEHEVK